MEWEVVSPLFVYSCSLRNLVGRTRTGENSGSEKDVRGRKSFSQMDPEDPVTIMPCLLIALVRRSIAGGGEDFVVGVETIIR